jgi:oligopeptide/dipeptide ABC transporter ATP-binding protein
VLNPALTIGQTITEPLRVHSHLSMAQARTHALGLLDEMGIVRPIQVMDSYPHQLSGGMKQRVVIATALATEPELLLLDEPTTALDVTVEAQILDLLDRLRTRHGLSMMLVSHNLGIVDRLCDRVVVLYAGRVVENGVTARVLDRPCHPYTKGLLSALPRLDAQRRDRLSPIPGGLPDLIRPDPGCNFRPRCPFVTDCCQQLQSLTGTDHQARCHRLDTVGALPWPSDENPGPATFGRQHPAQPRLLEARGLRRRFATGGMFKRTVRRSASYVMARCRLRQVKSLVWWESPEVARRPLVACCCGWLRRIPVQFDSTVRKSALAHFQSFGVAPRSCCKIRTPRSIHARLLRRSCVGPCSILSWIVALPRSSAYFELFNCQPLTRGDIRTNCPVERNNGLV